MSQGIQVRDFIEVKDVAQKLFDAYEKLLNTSESLSLRILEMVKVKLKNFAQEWWQKFDGKGS